MTITIVPGGVTGSEARALVLMRKLGSARPTINIASAPSAAAVTFEKLSGGRIVDAYLHARSVQVWRVIARGLAPDTTYTIGANAGGETCSARMRTLPTRLPTEGMTLAIGSCWYHGFHREERLRVALQSRRLFLLPRLLWLIGDNVYLDLREDGRLTNGGPEDVVQRYLDYFFDPSYLAARATMPAWTTWDDHEMWNDYPETQFQLPFTRPGTPRDHFEAAALGCLDLFQASLNPPSLNRQGGMTERSFATDVAPVSFFTADTRMGRKLDRGAASQLLPADTLNALCTWLDELQGPGVLCLGQPLWSRARNKAFLGLIAADHNPPAFTQQYQRIVESLRRSPWDVLVVSGDVHYSRLLRILPGAQADNRIVWELVSSPIVHIPSVWTTLGLSHGQSTDGIDDPTRVPEWPSARANYMFGTSAPNTYALLHLAPVAGGVRATVSFEDIAGTGAAAVTENTDLNRRTPGWGERRETNTFVLRQR